MTDAKASVILETLRRAAAAIPPYSPSEVVGWRQQFARALRSLRAAEEPEQNVEVKHDLLIHCYQDFWHLKDHIKNDDTLRQGVRDGVVAATHASMVLMECRDLCNGTKHLKTMNAPAAAISGDYGRTVYLGGLDGKSAMAVDVHPIIEFADRDPEDAVQFARDVAREWTEILVKQGLLII